MQLAHPKVAQPKLGAYSAPSLVLVSSTHPARMPDGPAKKPGGVPSIDSITTLFSLSCELFDCMYVFISFTFENLNKSNWLKISPG